MAARFDDSVRAALVAGARRVAESGLVLGSAGNLSVRDGEHVLITCRGVEFDSATNEDCVEVTVAGAASAGDGLQPSSELPLHLAIYAGTDASAIVHTHSHYATVLGTIVHELPAIHYAINRFGGPVRVARYETFGTDALANAVIEALEDRTAALMANHGAVATGRDVASAVDNAIHLEWLASIYYHAILCGSPSILTEAQLQAVRDQVRDLRYGMKARAQ